MEKCRDCGDILGAGSFCSRCKWVASGKSERDYRHCNRPEALAPPTPKQATLGNWSRLRPIIILVPTAVILACIL